MSEETSTSVVLNNVVEKLGNGADRLITDAEKFASGFLHRIDSVAPQIAADIKKIGLYAWQCMVRQQLAEGIFYTIAAVALPTLMYIYFRKLIPLFRDRSGVYSDPWDGGFIFVSILLCIGATVGSSIFLFYGVTHIMSPEYYAVEEFIEKLAALQRPVVIR